MVKSFNFDYLFIELHGLENIRYILNYFGSNAIFFYLSNKKRDIFINKNL